MFQSPGGIALELGPITIHWYGILIATAFLVGLFICRKVAKDKNENPDNFTDMATLILIFAVIGARLYYVLFNLNTYSNDWIDVFKIWQGGLAIHGGIIGGLIAGLIYTRHKKLSFAKYCDITSVGLVLAQAIGRWGNFFNSEAFGTPTDLPWKLFIPYTNRPLDYLNYDYFHPTFLYESIWDVSIFLLLFFVLRKKLDHLNGALFFCYLGLYSTGRFFIEGLRTDSLMMTEHLRTAQVVSLTCVVISIVAVLFIYKKNKALKTEE
ncbi:MAG: prolipoprotein diacylglyceryl transferase [Vampirovibrionia bacterium]